MSSQNTYDASSITVLEGLEAVRKRPGMYIGSVSTKGLNHLVYEIVDNAVDEHLAGVCDKICVTLEADGKSGAYDEVTLPARALTIDGDGHTLTAGDKRTRNYVDATADLTLADVQLNRAAAWEMMAIRIRLARRMRLGFFPGGSPSGAAASRPLP